MKGDLTPGKVIEAVRRRTTPQKSELDSGYSEAYRAMMADAAEALQQEEIPPGARLHVRDYFDSIRPGKKE